MYKTRDKYVFPTINCDVSRVWWSRVYSPWWSRVYPHLVSPIESSTKTPLWGFVLFIILLNVKLLYLYQKQYNSCKYLQMLLSTAEDLLGSTRRDSCDGESAFFPECLNRTWSDAISFRFESIIKIL